MAPADAVSEPDELTPEQSAAVREHLKEVIASPEFAGSKRAADFLQLIVDHTLGARMDNLRERMIGAEMFGRPIDYDTANDAVVRVKASEVRKKLAQYYSGVKQPPAVRIEIPAGSYVAKFLWEKPEEAAEAKPVVATPEDSSPVTTQDAQSSEPQPRFRRYFTERRRRISDRWLEVSAVVVLLAIVVYIGVREFSNRPRANSEVHSIAILPLANLSGDPQQEYFADGMTDELITDLGQVSALRVISRTSVMTYKGTKKRLPEIARELAVDAVVEGSVLREGNQVRVTAQLIDARADQHIWAQTYVRDLTSVLALQGEVAQAIADQVSIKLTPQEQARVTRAHPMNTEAQDLYLRGTHMLNTGEPRKAVEYLQQSVDKEPGFAPAHAALANAYGWLGEAGWLPYNEAFVREKTEAGKAIEIDNTLPEGDAELASADMNLNWGWDKAEEKLRRSLNLNPNFAAGHATYAFFLLRTGRTTEGLIEIKRDLELDPVSGRSFLNAGLAYYFARRYDEALAYTERAYQLEPNHAELFFPLGAIYSEKGDYAKAVHNFEQLGDQPHALGHLGNVYARMGKPEEARAILPKLEEHVARDGRGTYEIALIYAGLGEKSQAVSWLEKALAAHDKGMTYLVIDPCLDPLRDEPRFRDLARTVGLSVSRAR
jgi:TolB-like protein/Tfp pilus assembly protein PilF